MRPEEEATKTIDELLGLAGGASWTDRTSISGQVSAYLSVDRKATGVIEAKGGAVPAYQQFGDDLNSILKELGEVLAA